MPIVNTHAGKRRRRGFVQNEPLIVFGILCVVCVILAGLVPVAWYWRVLIGLGVASAVAAAFVAWAVRSDATRGREQAEEPADDAP
jgi:hypothetical protein